MERLTRAIQIIANIAIIGVCVLLGISLITRKGMGIHTSAGEANSINNLEGSTLAPLPGYEWKTYPATLVLFIRKGCHFCEASLPFYKKLADLEKSNDLHAHVLVVMPDDQKSGTSELQSSGITADGVFNESLSSINITGTPTLLLINSHGYIKRAWVGQLSAHGEQDVIFVTNNMAHPWYRLW